MYFEFFGVKENPFSLIADPRFLYYSAAHCEAMAHLLYGVSERRGLVLMVGAAGTGKTTVICSTLEMLRTSRVLISLIPNPMIESSEELLRAALTGFGVSSGKYSTMELLDILTRFLTQQVQRGRIPVLVVDEAQDIDKKVLGYIRLLSNLEFGGRKLLQIVLAGQPELGDRLAQPEYQALHQRITVRCRLVPFDPSDTLKYLLARLNAAGGDGRPIFTFDAAEAIYLYSAGVPRVINMIADNTLLAAYSRSEKTVDGPLVTAVANHLELVPVAAFAGKAGNIHASIMQAAASWEEISKSVEAGKVPEALRRYVRELAVARSDSPLRMSANSGE